MPARDFFLAALIPSHVPPAFALIPSLVRKAQELRTDLLIGSRFVQVEPARR